MREIAVKRIQHEIVELQKCGIKVELFKNNWQMIKAEIVGPSDTPYEGGNFILFIKIPDTYPFSPPTVRFVTKIWHPNICSETGQICLDILAAKWATTMTLRTLLLSIQALLSAAQPNDPLDFVIGDQYNENFETFQLTARHWTNVYAGGPNVNEDFDNKIKQLVGGGVLEHEARIALSSNRWDINEAIGYLFSE